MGRKLTKTHLRLTVEINAAIQCRRFTPAETCVLHAIIGGTFGVWDWKAKEAKDRAEFTLDSLVSSTGLYRGQVHAALKSLTRDRVLRVYREGAPRVSTILGIEDHTDLWARPKNLMARQLQSENSDRKLQSENSDRSHSRETPTVEQSENSDRIQSENSDRKSSVFPTVSSKQSGTVKPKKPSVDHVDLPKGSNRSLDDDDKNSSVYDPIRTPFPAFEEILRAVSPIPFNRSPRESAVLLDYVELADWTQAQKLDALRLGVAETQAYLAKKKASGPVVCWVIDKATKHLATLDTKTEIVEPPEVEDDGRPGWWEEPARLWQERQENERSKPND